MRSRRTHQELRQSESETVGRVFRTQMLQVQMRRRIAITAAQIIKVETIVEKDRHCHYIESLVFNFTHKYIILAQQFDTDTVYIFESQRP